MTGIAPEAPFEAPWQARAFAMAHAFPRAEFQSRLAAAIAADPERPYWESWLAALEAIASITVSEGVAPGT